MGDKTKIQWADATINPSVGCRPVSEGCEHCYASRVALGIVQKMNGLANPTERQAQLLDDYRKVVDPLGCWNGMIRSRDSELWQIKQWRRPRRIFVGSMTDWMYDGHDSPHLTICKILDTMTVCPQHQFLTLTKRASNLHRFFAEVEYGYRWRVPDNCWLGVTAENQTRADERIPLLMNIPAPIRWVSLEPLLGPVDIERFLAGCPACGCQSIASALSDSRLLYCEGCENVFKEMGQKLDWVVVGCESGPHRRPCEIEWVESVVGQCCSAGVACFVKQLNINGKISKNPDEWPEHLRFRQWPERKTIHE